MKRMLLPSALKIAGRAVFFALVLASPLFGQWQPDSQLSYDPNLSYTSACNAWCVGAAGDTVHVVWWDDRFNTNGDVFYRRSQDGGTTWGAETRIRWDSLDTYSFAPAVAVSGSTVHCVWIDGRSGTYEIYYDRSTDGGTTWGADVALTADPADSYYPSAAAAGSQVHVVWQDTRDGNTEIYYKRSTDAGGSWSADARLTANSGQSTYPTVAVNGSNVHVAWFDDRDGNPEIYCLRSTDAGASWGPETRLTNAPNNSDFASIAAFGPYVHVVWRDWRDGNFEIYHKRSTDGGASWGADARLTNDAGISTFPSAAVCGSNVHVVFNDNRSGNMEIYYKVSTDAGATWSADIRLTNAALISRKPSVCTAGPRVHVVWEDNRIAPPGNYEVFYKTDPTGNAMGIGVSDDRGRGEGVRLEISPNPFVSFASVAGREKEVFIVFDLSGRKVAECRGARIGAGLPAGVYFVRPEDGTGAPRRTVKIR